MMTVDLRSDTVTQPTPGMLQAMLSAKLVMMFLARTKPLPAWKKK